MELNIFFMLEKEALSG